MSSKRNIDQLFKDQLGQFEATPSPEVWSKIEARLKQEKDDRKVIPLWWKLGGVAAVLALLLTLGNSLFDSTITQDAVVEESSVPSDSDTLFKDSTKEFKNTQDGLVTPEKNHSEPDSKILNELEPNDAHGIVADENSKDLNPRDLPKTSKHKKAPASNDFAVKERNGPKGVDKKTILPKGISPTITDVDDKAIAASKIPRQNESLVVPDPANTIIPDADKGVAGEVPSVLKEDENIHPHKKSIFDAIEENNKEEIAIINEKTQRSWEVTPNVGPVYYNSLSGGSSIDPSFADNNQSGEVNFSYGVQVAYNVNDRFSVRTGVNNVNVGYTTGGIEIASGPASFALKTVDYPDPSRNVLSAFDKGTIPSNGNDPNNPYGQLNLKSTSGNAEIRQSITYFEVPLEAKYVLSDNRFGINMIGGFSTFFLNGSEVSVSDGSFRSVLGEANNLNSLSFSTNVGLGFDYKFSSKLKFNVEPMFKYQLNPYTDTSVDFKPYYFGIYSGLSFKF